MPLTSSFLRQYRFDGGPAARLERALAAGRAFLTVAGLVAIYLDPTEPERLVPATYAILFAYAVYSVIVLVLVRRKASIDPSDALLMHGVDILWTSGLIFVSDGPVSPFFLFYLFAVLAAAYRWGFRETVATGAISGAVFLLETTIILAGPWHETWFASMDLDLVRTIYRAAYLMLTASLLGYLAEQDKQSRAEATALADIARQPRVDLGLSGSVWAVGNGLLRTFDSAAVVIIVLQEFETQRTLLWRLERAAEATTVPTPVLRELDQADEALWLFTDPGRAWQAEASADGTLVALRTTVPGAWPLKRLREPVPDALGSGGAFTTITAANMGLQDEWRGRVYVYDVSPLDNLERYLHFLETLTERITPALTNVFLVRRLHSQVTAAERARVARELHDGAIQSLFGIEMKIEALRRGPLLAGADADRELGDVQHLVRREVLALREVMQALRPVELDSSEQLPDVLGSVVERFRRDSGVSARFVSTGDAVALHPRTALEVVRIVQEALVNVRKHSRASNVIVRLTRDNGHYRLVVEDDGCGFEFAGRLCASELDRLRTGPAVIKERARIVGAEFVVDSTPGAGARLELTFAAGSRG